ncbi:hypothetical protein ABT121_44710, partial [Streptomyces sp. NPDC001928]
MNAGTNPGTRTCLNGAASGAVTSGVKHLVTRRSGPVAALLGACLALLPPTAAHADSIRAQQWALEAMHTEQAWQTTKGRGVIVAGRRPRGGAAPPPRPRPRPRGPGRGGGGA